LPGWDAVAHHLPVDLPSNAVVLTSFSTVNIDVHVPSTATSNEFPSNSSTEASISAPHATDFNSSDATNSSSTSSDSLLSVIYPKILHQFWAGEVSNRPIQLMESCRVMHPHWEYRLWNESAFEWFSEVSRDLIRRTHQWPMKADIARLEILKRFGGVYLDADTECLKPLDPLLEQISRLNHTECFAAREHDIYNDLVANGVLGCVPNSTSMAVMVEGLLGKKPAEAAWIETGPAYFTTMIKEHKVNFTVLSSMVFYPIHHSDFKKDLRTFDLSHSYATHHWGSTHFSYGRMKAIGGQSVDNGFKLE